MKRRTILLLLSVFSLFSFYGTRVRAGEAAVEQVPAGSGESRKITFHAEHATRKQIVEGFSKAANVRLDMSAEPNQFRLPAPLVYYDLDIKDLPLESALDRLGHVLNLQVQGDQNGSNFQIRPYNPVGYYNPYQDQFTPGPLRVSPQSVARHNFLPASSNAPELEVDFRIEGGQAQKARGQPKPLIETATDDQGKALTLIVQQFGSYNQFSPIWQISPQLMLRCGDPAPKKIAKLKGAFEWQVPATLTRVTFTGLREGKPIKTDFKGYEVELGAPQKNGGNWQIELTVHRGATLSAGDWDAHKDLFAEAFAQSKVTDINGDSFTFRGGGVGDSDKNQARANMNFAKDNQNAPEALPDVLIWEVVQETTMLRVPFEASDLPVP